MQGLKFRLQGLELEEFRASGFEGFQILGFRVFLCLEFRSGGVWLRKLSSTPTNSYTNPNNPPTCLSSSGNSERKCMHVQITVRLGIHQ